ncbi:bifunctional diguanylate cyclase/phosphodiesterase [Kineococcus sp. NBC_00420]|uniref:putative bifunctional diguanylate cyclase/phosphodiesterase n=1 Tax=unclassified Kineococcus TaxID=2621656 RepID=UPI002E1FC2BC
MNRLPGNALLATLVVGGAGLLADRASRHLDGRLISACLLLAMLIGTLLLHRRRRDPGFDRGMSPTTWRAFSAAGVVLLLTATADLAVGVLDGRGFWTGMPLGLGTFVAGPLIMHGLFHWNSQVRHVLAGGQALTSGSAVLVVVAAGNLLLPHLPADFGDWAWWQVQVWLLTVGILLVLLGTTLVVARTAGLARDVRIWSLGGSLLAYALVDGFVAVEGGAGFTAVQAAGATGVLVMGAAVLRARTPTRVIVNAEVSAGGAMLVLVTAFCVVALACVHDLTPTAILWGSLAALGSAICLARHLGQLSELARARVEARTDDLTGVGNRRALVDQVEELAHGGSGAALLKVDVDDFGLVNERLGHHDGDQLLVTLAEAVRAAAPPTALVARSAGDTFAVLLAHADEAVALRLAARLERVVRELPTPGRLGTGISASIGVATTAAGDPRTADLVHRAGAALVLAKTGQRGIACYDGELEARARDRLSLIADLTAALDDASRAEVELLLHYQPQLEVRTGRVVGVEALVRWQHPARGFLGPDRFLDLAEENGLMDDLTAHLLERAAREVADWEVDDVPLRVSVNLSAGSLASPDLLPTVDAVLRRTGLDPTRLVLEITETTLMDDPELAVQVTESLVARGISLSIDDYGTGYSSLAYLTDLPASELKLDRAFTLRITTEPRTAAIVEGTVALAHRLGLRVIAEGVEDLEALGVLRDLGADETQGYLHSRPLAPAAFRTWLADRSRESDALPA